VRCLDINPFLPLGIDLDESRFLDAFLLFCALEDSPCLVQGECGASSDNFLKVVTEGRKPGLELRRGGEQVSLQAWAQELLGEIGQVAALLDQSQGGDRHARALAAQQAKVADSSLTPSARVLDALKRSGESFSQFAQRQTQAHAEYFRSQPLDAAEQAAFETAAQRSHDEQAALEAQQESDFDQFVAAYQASLLSIGI